MDDELHAPLGRRAPERGNRSYGRLLWIASGALAFAGVAALALLPQDPYAGQPHAVAKIEPPPPPKAPLSDEAAPAEPSRQTGPANPEMQGGVRMTSGAPGETPADGPLVIKVDPAGAIRLPPAPDWRVTEKGRYGLLPKIGPDGARPLQIYARPFVAPANMKPDAPKIALVVGGLGLNPAATMTAIDELPEAVTLAFAPYGANLDQLAARARERGHELLLQAPMEPFDFPNVDPGPHTLLTVGADANVDDLRWLMSRFSGYAGVMNYLGARFTSDEGALTPVLSELSQRGLFYLDDGASPQSIAVEVARRLSLPAARVDVILDAGRSPQALDAALTELEAQARRSGVAIGFANGAPATVTRLARFIREAERRGVVIAPATSLLDQRPEPPPSAGVVVIRDGDGPQRTIIGKPKAAPKSDAKNGKK